MRCGQRPQRELYRRRQRTRRQAPPATPPLHNPLPCASPRAIAAGRPPSGPHSAGAAAMLLCRPSALPCSLLRRSLCSLPPRSRAPDGKGEPKRGTEPGVSPRGAQNQGQTRAQPAPVLNAKALRNLRHCLHSILRIPVAVAAAAAGHSVWVEANFSRSFSCVPHLSWGGPAALGSASTPHGGGALLGVPGSSHASTGRPPRRGVGGRRRRWIRRPWPCHVLLPV